MTLIHEEKEPADKPGGACQTSCMYPDTWTDPRLPRHEICSETPTSPRVTWHPLVRVGGLLVKRQYRAQGNHPTAPVEHAEHGTAAG